MIETMAPSLLASGPRISSADLPKKSWRVANTSEAHARQWHFHIGAAREDLRQKFRGLGKQAVATFHDAEKTRAIRREILD
ncbi:hypothetical protein, partial [Mesorhizobium sp. M1A.F.Ca.ET.072.01.1.1]|uniref:hypothetical protein n=1 Tax=Mesorhizobium sp. M1A.F.Ca.ET.072.01.1.1 TaxID=2496753 RepID=UPI00167C03CE